MKKKAKRTKKKAVPKKPDILDTSDFEETALACAKSGACALAGYTGST